MYEKILNIDTEALSKSVINDIAYVYGAFASGADEDYKGFRTMISPWDQNLVRFIDKKAADRIADMNDFVCPYDLLMSNVTGDITKFYDDAEKKFDDILAFFGDKADKVRSQVKNDFEKSKQTTMKKVEDELYSCVMQELSAKDTIEKMQTLLSDREKSINEIIDSECLQILKYVVLWEYQDEGYKEYIILTDGENCGGCNDKEGRTFLISGAETYVNFPPFHPNCNCSAGIIDRNGNVVLKLDGNGLFLLHEKVINAVIKSVMNAVLYIDKSFRTFIEGDFSDESPTIPAIILNLVLGFSGVDVPMDVRDLAASIIKFDGTLKSWGRLGINIIALLPAIGTLKYFIDAFDAAKPIIKNSDEIADVVKGISKSGLGDDIVDIGKSVAKNSDETADIAKGIAESGLEDDIADTVKSAAKNADESTDIGKEIANESSDAAKVSDSSKNISKSSYKIVNGYEAKVNVGQQNKHIPGSNEHKISLNNGETKSIMYGNLDDIQKLLDDKAGTGKFINIGKNRERVDFGQVIGLYIDPETGISMETTVGTIHYGKKGAHIVPARPKQ